MAYAKTDEFVQICIENDFDIKAICNELHKLYPAQDVRPYKVEQRIAILFELGALMRVLGVFDGKVRLNFTDKTVYVIAEDRRPGTPVDVRSFNAASPFTRGGLCKGLQSLARQYQVVLNKQTS